MRAAIFALAAVTLAAQAHAQPGAGPPPGSPSGEPPRGWLYISPAGEPFRSGDGLRAWFAGADVDHDATLTPGEFQADAERFFKVLDEDGNGALRGPELQAYERDVAPEIVGLYGGGRPEMGPGRQRTKDPGGGPRRGRPAGRDRGRGAAAREGAARFSLLNIPQPVTGSDLDGDRKVTLDEWTRTARIRFGLLDRAGAGRLTLDTLPPLPGARPKPRQAGALDPRAGTTDTRVLATAVGRCSPKG